MKSCRHPQNALQWQPKDQVFLCRRCGQIIFPAPPVTPEDEYDEWDDALCWNCGGTGIDLFGEPCEACAGEGYMPT